MSKPVAVLFDLYNTLVDIRTDEHAPYVWEQISQYLTYHGVVVDSNQLNSHFTQQIREQQARAKEEFPEVDIAAIFQTFLSPGLVAEPGQEAVRLAQLFRSLSMCRIQLFPDSLPALEALQGIPLALVSDAQRFWLEPELKRLGLDRYFPVRVVSSDHGYRKPDPRLFHQALDQLGLRPEQAIFVGDSPFRDVYGAQQAGLRGCWVCRHEPFEDADSEVSPDLTFSSLLQFVDWYHSQ